MAPVLTKYPHEARVQRWGYGVLAAAIVLGALLVLGSDGGFLGYSVPPLVSYALLLLGAGLGVAAIARRQSPLALAAGAALALAVVPAGALTPGILGYFEGLAFGALVLGFGELVHMTQRYDRAHQLIEKEGVGEDSLDRVTDEALRTLGERALLATGLALIPTSLALILAFIGPAAWREGLETASPLGIAVIALALFGGVMLIILTRGATLTPAPVPKEAVAVAESAE